MLALYKFPALAEISTAPDAQATRTKIMVLAIDDQAAAEAARLLHEWSTASAIKNATAEPDRNWIIARSRTPPTKT